MSDYPIETRRRSRSKTPFLRSSCDHEICEHTEEGHHHHQHHKKKALAANVQTIVEEVIEVTSSSSSPPKQSRQIQQIKTKTSDYSSEDTSPENKDKRPVQSVVMKPSSLAASQTSSASTTTFVTSRTTTTTASKSKRVSGNTLGHNAATSTPNSSYMAERFDRSGLDAVARRQEITQNELNAKRELEASAHSNSSSKRSNKNASLSRLFGESFDSSTADLSDHLAYLEYKRVGEYWNKTPKTDYTYSEFSPHRRVLAPGIVAMPNMSRRSLENYNDRAHFMHNYEQEEYVRGRTNQYAQSNVRATENLLYDSGDELDFNRFAGHRRKQDYYYNSKYGAKEQQSWFWRIITTIVTTITTLTGGGDSGAAAYNKRTTMYSTATGTAVNRGFFSTIGHGLAATASGIWHYINIAISSILCFDAWLLQSRHAHNRGRKRFLLLLLLLLPLLLLAAAMWRAPESERVAYVQRVHTLWPTSLSGAVSSTLELAGASLYGLSALPSALVKRFVSSSQTSGAVNTAELQKALPAAQYDALLLHINSYVQQVIELRSQQDLATTKPMSAEQMAVIARVVREQLDSWRTREKRDSSAAEVKLSALSAVDLQHLAQLVQVELTAAKYTAPVHWSAEHREEIRRLIVEHVAAHDRVRVEALLVERLDLDALLTRLLGAPALAHYVDSRIAAKWADLQLELQQQQAGRGSAEQQQAIIARLNSELAAIKASLLNGQSANAALQHSVGELQSSQDGLLFRLQQHELATTARFTELLTEIESKLVKLQGEHFVLLNRQMRLLLLELIGPKDSLHGAAELSDAELQQLMGSMFVARDYLEERLRSVNEHADDKIREAIDLSAAVLMRDIGGRLKQEILVAVDARQQVNTVTLKGEIQTALSEAEVRKIVKAVLAIYDADKTGLVDFALESAGGQILSTRCTESYQSKTAQLSVFGIPLWYYPTNTPRVAISPNVQPGECWAFQGFPGFLVLKLNTLVYVTGFTLEHIPESLSPNGRIESAPRNFTVWGLEHEKDYEPVLFGEYEYADNNAPLQYFPLRNSNVKRPYDIVELRIESNHGHPQYTCLYRFRVHGKPPAA